MVKLTASDGDINTSDQLQMASAYGKVFIANGTNLKVADFQNTKIATTNVGSHPPDRGNELTGGISGAKMIVDYITALSGAVTIYGYRITEETFTTETVTGTDNDGNPISFTTSGAETAPPHWYNWTVYGGDTDHYGKLPSQAYIIGVSGGRLMLSGNRDYPHQVPTSAVGNPWDWNVFRTTADRATIIGTGTAGAIGDVVRAIIPVRDGQLIIGCATSMHAVIDNPAYGGQVVAIDKTVGIFDGTSWCFDGDGNLFFFGTGGLHKVTRGALSVETVNRVSLPSLVEDEAADPSTHRITMGYDPVRVGLKICITVLADGSHSDYWYDLRTGGFFPEASASTSQGVYSMFYYDANNPDHRGLLMGCADGYIRVHDDNEKNDDGVAINSYVCFGPIALAEDGKDGSIAAFDAVLSGGAADGSAKGSDDVTMNVWAEDVAEKIDEDFAADANPKLSFTFIGPGRRRGGKRRRGVRGAYVGIKLGNSTINETWGFEKLILDPGRPGRRLQ